MFVNLFIDFSPYFLFQRRKSPAPPFTTFDDNPVAAALPTTQKVYFCVLRQCHSATAIRGQARCC